VVPASANVISRTSGFGNINGIRLFRSAHRSPNVISMMLRAYLVTGVRIESHSHGHARVCESLVLPSFTMAFPRVVRCGDGRRPPGAVSSVLTVYLYFIPHQKLHERGRTGALTVLALLICPMSCAPCEEAICQALLVVIFRCYWSAHLISAQCKKKMFFARLFFFLSALVKVNKKRFYNFIFDSRTMIQLI
jgi:hypothetical protein